MASLQKPKQPTSARPPLTHFLCLPLVNAGSAIPLRDSLSRFRDEVQDNEFFSPRAFRPLNTLHCTLGVMSLDERRLEEAKQVLAEIDPLELLRNLNHVKSGQDGASTAKDSPLQINLRGLGSFRQPTSVLYSDPKDETDRLYPFCLAIKERFQKFLVDEHRDLTLHVTVVNTIYAKGAKSRGKRGGGRSSATASKFQSKFDATALIEQFKHFDWASNVTLDRLCICEMGAKKTFDEAGKVVDEEYTEVAAIRLPT